MKLTKYLLLLLLLSGIIHSQKLYWVDGSTGKIQSSNLDGSALTDLATGTGKSYDIAVDLANSKIYWVDNTNKLIRSCSTSGGSVTTLISTAAGSIINPRGLALDAAGNKIYWSDNGSKKIRRANLDGSGIADVVTGLTAPAYIAFDPLNNKLYYADNGRGVKTIFRCNADGAGIETVVTGLSQIRGIALNAREGVIYWIDNGTRKIQKGSLSALPVTKTDVLTGLSGKLRGLTIDAVNNLMYWTDTGNDNIMKSNTDGSGITALTGSISFPQGIALNWNSSAGYGVPVLTVKPAGNVLAASATLNAQINPQGTSTSYFFRYGTDPSNLTQTTTVQDAGSGITPVSVTSGLTSLSPRRAYYYSLSATNSYGTTSSPVNVVFFDDAIPSAGLVMRFRADAGVITSASKVADWKDISNNNNNALQSLIPLQPEYQSNVIIGQPVVRFNGTTTKLQLPSADQLGIMNHDYEVFIVARTASTNVQFLIAGAMEQYEFHLNGAAGARFIPKTSTYIDKSAAGFFADNLPHLFSGRASSSGGTVRVDGVEGASSASSLYSSSTTPLLLGARADNTYYLNGDIAEVILYNSVLSSESRQMVEQYVASRYGITSGTLPVELLSFRAVVKNSSAILSWTTATEVNNYGFEIQRRQEAEGRSQDEEWEKIGFVKGSGNSNSPIEYSFTDPAPLTGSSFYRLKQVDNDGGFRYYDALQVNIEAPKEYRLIQNSPNPFNPVTAIKYQMPTDGIVTLKVYDQLGREIITLVNEHRPAGSHIVYWNGRGSNGETVSSGVYIYRLSAGGYSETRKMNFLK